jgi:hypothetical protein
LDDSVVAYLFVAGIEDQIGVSVGEAPLRELGQPFVEAFVDGADRRFAKACPHSSSVIAFTLRVDTPCTYISTKADTSAFSLRWKRSNNAVENCANRSRGIRSSILPTRVINPFVISGAISQPLATALSRRGAEKVRHLGLENLIERFFTSNLSKSLSCAISASNRGRTVLSFLSFTVWPSAEGFR